MDSATAASQRENSNNSRILLEAPTSLGVPAPIQRDFATSQTGPNTYTAEIPARWNVVRGPNGGFLAAVILQTMMRHLADEERRPRLMTLHYPSVPRPGAVEVRVQVSRVGKSVSWLAADVYQNEALCVAARAAFSRPWPGVEYDNVAFPDVPPPESGQALPHGLPPFTQHYEYRSLFATPGSPRTHDRVGGWMRPRDSERYDAPLLAAMTDAWFPSTLAFDSRMTMAATLDLTVHFRDYDAIGKLAANSFILSAFGSRLATEGFFEEDGELWAPSGKLLVQSRQLALATPIG